MRAANTTRLLILSGCCLGCYVQPYNPPPAQPGPSGEAQPAPAAPYDQTQPPPAEQPPPQQPYAQQQGWVGQPPPPSSPPAPPASAPVDSGPVYDDVNVEVAGSNVPSVDVFYNDLAPYGSWYNDSTYGWVFAPPSTSYVALLERPLGVHGLRLHLGVGRSVRLGDRSLRPLGVGEPLGLASGHDVGPGLGAMAPG